MKRIFIGLVALAVLAASAGSAVAANTIRVVAFGDSLTSGYQLTEEASYAAQLKKKLIGVGYTNLEIVNMSVAGETTAGGLERLSALLLKQPDIVVLQLGANDVIRGINPNVIYQNLIHIIGRLKENNVYVVLIGMKAPPHLGSEYVRQVESIYARMASFYQLAFYPDALDGIYGNPELTLADGLHPNSNGIELMVENTYRLVDAGLRWKWEVMQYQEEYKQKWAQETTEGNPVSAGTDAGSGGSVLQYKGAPVPADPTAPMPAPR
ncbi:MAG: arylesterase [Alphaproteobacteria bacterium]